MASSVLRCMACASALGASAVALSRQPEEWGPLSQEGPLNPLSQDGPLKPADDLADANPFSQDGPLKPADVPADPIAASLEAAAVAQGAAPDAEATAAGAAAVADGAAPVSPEARAAPEGTAAAAGAAAALVAAVAAKGVAPSCNLKAGGPILPDELVTNLEPWAHGPLFSENSSLHRATVKSRLGEHDLTIATFGQWEDQEVSKQLLSGNDWATNHINDLCSRFKYKAGGVGNFLDVGAHVGSLTIPMADCLSYHGGRVIAVEGMPPIADHLAVGILANNFQNVDMYMYAVGADDDPKKVTMSLNPVNKAGSAVKGNKKFTVASGDELQDLFHPGKRQRSAQKVTVREYEVPLTTGDRMLAANPALKAITMAKVDIEGHEGHFLKGSQCLFSKYPPCIMTIELIPEWLERAGTPVEEVIDMLAGWGYDVPTAAHLRTLSPRAQTKTITQKNLTACLERVAAYAPESGSNAFAEPNFADSNALNTILAREARAKELDAMLVRDSSRGSMAVTPEGNSSAETTSGASEEDEEEAL